VADCPALDCPVPDCPVVDCRMAELQDPIPACFPAWEQRPESVVGQETCPREGHLKGKSAIF